MSGALSPIEVSTLSFILILARVSTFVSVLPLFEGRNVPRMVKIALALALTGLWFGTYGTTPSPSVVALAAAPHWLAYAVAVATEMLFGAMLGYAFGLLFLPARIAGSYIGQEMGLTLASLTDPGTGNSLNVVGQAFDALGVLLFFALDIHHVLLGTLHVTFSRWPVGSSWRELPILSLTSGLADAHEWGIMLAAPLAICLFLTIVVLALLAKTSPQMNLFSVGLTLRLAVGLGATLIFLPEMIAMMGHWFGKAANLIQHLGM